MNWFITDDCYAINLDRVNEAVRHKGGKVVVYFSDREESVLHDDDAARFWAMLGGQYECSPTEADRRAAVNAFRRQRGDAGHDDGPTPVEALGEPMTPRDQVLWDNFAAVVFGDDDDRDRVRAQLDALDAADPSPV